MPTPPTAERPTERERGTADYIFSERAVSQQTFNAEMRRVDSEQSTLARTLERIESRFNKIDERFDKIDAKFEKIDERFDKMNAKIDGVQTGLNAKIDNLFYWMIGTMIVLTGLFSSIVFAVFKG
ncbi:hypothetical protein FACS1894187_18650 [Synergistales bacterium]|nr:hypothetical protein FACS1894187_18650 [Synergistales bacterium]GHV44485.1 hypothetical protein FACS1894204_01650 [Synergistales bacterium]